MKTFTMLLCGCIITAALQGQDTIYVPAGSSIQAGINDAEPGDIVLVADGTYYEQINFLGKPITVASWYLRDGNEDHIDNTIIDGSQINDSINGSIVTFKNGEDTTSVLCGFTVRNGNIGTLCNTDSVSTEINARAGGGVFIYNCGAKIIHNHITENHIVDAGFTGNPRYIDGGGIYHGPYLQDEHWVVIDGNSIDFNSTHSGYKASIGGGAIVQSSSIITNNIISGNISSSSGNAFSWGGGLVGSNNPNFPSQVQFIVENNTISDNQVISSYVAEAAGAVFEHAVSLVSGNEVDYNIADAPSGFTAGLVIVRPQEGSLVSGNIFNGNETTGWQGGLLVYSDYTSIYQDTATVLVENNYFIGNEARNGGGLQVENTLAILQNNVFAHNHALISAGAVRIYNSLLPVEHMVKIINNSFSENKADVAGGAIFSNGDLPLVINSIFWNDSCAAGYGSEIHLNQLNETVEIANSNIDTNHINRRIVDGGGNIWGEDPLFDNPDSLTLSPGSPCLNAGADLYTCECGVTHYCPLYDIEGNVRPLNELFEMGAYEQLTGGLPSSQGIFQLDKVYPNPFNSQTAIYYALKNEARVKITVLNGFGQVVATPVSSFQQAGEHQVIFNAENLPAGLYFYRIEAGKMRGSGKMVVVR